MARSRNPVAAFLTMALVGALVGIIARFVYGAYVITEAGESLRSIPPTPLLFEVMEIHWYALYGAGVGAVLGVMIIVIDTLRYGAGEDEPEWRPREVIKPFAEDAVKSRRMEAGSRYLEESAHKDDADKSG